jgi:small subunit ribosomal protein S6
LTTEALQPFRSLRTHGADKGQSHGKEDSKMRDYELIIIIHPDQDETAVNALIEKVKGWLKDSGGAVQEVENWGRRTMAYAIKKEREGNYVLFKMQMAPSFSATLERNLGFQETILRFLITAK